MLPRVSEVAFPYLSLSHRYRLSTLTFADAMPTDAALQADYNALNELVVNCPELAEVESLMGGFNLFSVLGFEYGELRHSNALAWLFDPSESQWSRGLLSSALADDGPA